MSSPLPPGWNAYQTPDGRWYFVDSASGQTQWHHPMAPPPAGPPPPQAYPSHGPPPQTSQPQMHAHPSSSGAAGRHGHHISAAAAAYVMPQPTEFKLKEKAFSLSGDSFSVKRVDTGEATFKVKGNALSLKDSKTIQDANGNALYKMTEALLTLRGRMTITDASTKQPVITLRKKGYLPTLFKAKTIQAWAGGDDEGDPYLEVKGDFLRKDFNVNEVATGRTLASIKRKGFNFSNLVLDKDTYIIRVEPGVDTALLVFFVIAVDEMFRDDGNNQGLF